MEIILASASPRRQELLRYITPNFRIEASDVEEIAPEGLPLMELPAYLATLKAKEVSCRHPESLVIGSDTGVFIDGLMLGKPASEAEGKSMLERLSGRRHEVITGCCLCWQGQTISFAESTEVEFYPLNETEICNYLSTAEYKDKAGAYGIQGAGALLIRGIHGDYYNVMGLPIARLARELNNLFSC